MIKVGSLVRAKKEHYESYMRHAFNREDLLLVLTEEKFYTGFLNNVPCCACDCPDVVKEVTVYKLLFPRNKIFTWADYQLEEVQ